jgi:CubicO group peptidase (beta-lactamase class C family)
VVTLLSLPLSALPSVVLPSRFAAAAAPKAARLSPQEKGDAEAAGLDVMKLSALRAEMEGFVASGEIAGAVALMGRRGRIGTVQAVGLADVRSKTPMRASTLFRIEAMTRVATAIAVLMLRDDGLLSLDDEVTKYLPAFCGQRVLTADAAGGQPVDLVRPITVADLLRETSGLSCANDSTVDAPMPATKLAVRARAPRTSRTSRTSRTLASVVDGIAQQSLQRQPGQQVERCDANYLALGRIVEVAGRQKFDAFMQKRLFVPLRMTGARFRTGPRRCRCGAGHQIGARGRSGG